MALPGFSREFQVNQLQHVCIAIYLGDFVAEGSDDFHLN